MNLKLTLVNLILSQSKIKLVTEKVKFDSGTLIYLYFKKSTNFILCLLIQPFW